MKIRYLSILACPLVVFSMLASTSVADTNIVTENFDSYANQSAFEAVWRPDDGTGIDPLNEPTEAVAPVALLIPNANLTIDPPNDNPPGIQGNAVVFQSEVSEYDPDNDPLTPSFQIVPSSTQAVRISGDIFDDTAGNKRASLGLRSVINRSVSDPGPPVTYSGDSANLIELGHWNAGVTDPTNGSPINDVTGYAYRVILFDDSSIGAPLTQTPNWQFFPLDPVLDTKDGAAQPNPDGLVTPVDIGVGWHRYTATITETTVTFELDLFRDGLANTEATEGVGTPGVDSSVTWTIAPRDTEAGDGFDFNPFNSLRFGAPSGITSANLSVIDNISLDLIDLVASGDNADFSGNDLVDGSDFLIWQRNLGTPDPLQTDGDANEDDAVDATDLSIWNSQYGSPPPAVASVTAVPEPTSGFLGLLLITMGVAVRRR